MKLHVLIGVIALGCFGGQSLYGQTDSGQSTVRKLYERAMQQYNNGGSDGQADSLALASFGRVIKAFPPNRANASLILDSYLHSGILKQTANQQNAALGCYQKAIGTGQRFNLADSLLFKPYLYAGTVYYRLQDFDSATYYYKKAEQIFLRFPQPDEARRLYNSFGVIYYESGNYQQSINYFQKALQLNRPGAENKEYYLAYTSNIASALRHLEQYDSAAALYKKLLPLDVSRRQELLINLGITYLEKTDPVQALYYLRQIKTPENRYAVRYENALGRAYAQGGQFGAATTHLSTALALHKAKGQTGGKKRKSKDIGLTYKLLGDVAVKKKRYGEAVNYYHKAIIQLDSEFDEPDISRNPNQFSEGLNSFLLFETLAAKAYCQDKLSADKNSGNAGFLALNAYRSALLLAEHIQKVFDSEEARLFALKKIGPIHQQTVSLLIRLHEQTGKATFLTEAFQRSEQSKSAVLFLGQKENESKTNTGIPDHLLQRERNLKFKLSQLFIRNDRATSDGESAQLRAAIRDTKLDLSRLADQLHDYPDYYRKKFGADTISLSFLQQKVLGRKKALLSFFQTPQTTYTFVLTRNQLQYVQTPNDPTFQRQLASLITVLRSAEPGEKYPAERQAQFLYNRLIRPVADYLSGVESLIIIPHNDLSQLSFEALENEAFRYLVEDYAVTYQYSASFLRPESQPSLSPKRVLGVAPFNVTGLNGVLSVLPASQREIEALPGVKLMNREATKNRFLTLAQQASVIHLATHAIANNEFPDQSYIAFMPQQDGENKLFAHELQYGVLNQVKLVFLSACETASGQLIRGEGVMSLSRALSYAGSPNLITSLWKAEDNATAYLSGQFYTHLGEGNDIARSLQLAKLDLLQNGQLAQYHSPQYWSHLIFVGSTPTETSGEMPLGWLLAGGLVLLVTGLIFWKYKGKKKSL